MAEGIEIERALKRSDLALIDVRSPQEFERESIPGAINIPLFLDDQRRQLGLIYSTAGEKAARRAGLDFVSPRLPEIVDQICRAAGDKTPLLYCWRGGMRSYSLYRILDMLKIPALRLKGGYRAYRKYVYRELSSYRIKPEVIVLNGLTGTGKTALIRHLIAHHHPAIDLEGLACHRGSVFGTVGFAAQQSQKDFESLLLTELNKFQDSPYLVLEGEGTRIGPIHLPQFLTRAMKEGVHVLVTAPLEIRARRIREEYLSPELAAGDRERIEQGLMSLEQRLGKARTSRLLSLFRQGDYLPAVREICAGYYDRLYEDAKPENREFAAVLEAAHTAAAAQQLIDFLNRRHHKSCLTQKEDAFT